MSTATATLPRPAISQFLLWLNAILPPFMWAGLIFFFSSQQQLPGFDAPTWDFFFKKAAHMFVYAVLYYLLHRGVKLTLTKKYSHYAWLLALLLCFVYALSDELHQAYVINRTASPRDIGYDMLGAWVVMLKLYKYI